MTSDTKIWAIIPAAGAGARMQAGIAKQYLPLLGRPVILHTLERLCGYSGLTGLMVGLAPQDRHWDSVSTNGLAKFLGTYVGGNTRARTVLNGLVALSERAQNGDWVMVHDAVRPCVRHADIDKLVEAAAISPDGALLALPISDTIKRADDAALIEETVPRVGLWRAMTPQMFRFGLLRDALTKIVARNEDVTDDSAAVERLGARPRVVESSADNIKITRPGDLQLAELFIRQQRGDAT